MKLPFPNILIKRMHIASDTNCRDRFHDRITMIPEQNGIHHGKGHEILSQQRVSTVLYYAKWWLFNPKEILMPSLVLLLDRIEFKRKLLTYVAINLLLL